MAAVPLSLSTYIEDRAGIARQSHSTRTMFDPVLGMASWRDLAKQLVAGLSWLHGQAEIVHGDIKPHNILLRPRHEDAGHDPGALIYEPLYADFSSAHDLSSSSSLHSSPASLSALTPPFVAPELLSVSVLKSPTMIATEASDVFSLAVTLLAAAIGDLLLYPAKSSMQRLTMCRDGHRVLEFVRAGAHGSRVPRKGVIEAAIQPAVVQDPDKRIKPEEWLKLVDP
jgi:serine/threonine protein kinase